MGTTISIRIDDDIKQEAQELFAKLGMDMSTAVNVFIRQALRCGGIPFKIRVPNADTLAAIAEVREMQAHPENYKTYASADELMRDVFKK
ncbi:addiction module antitoxin RelB [Campylobacterota bacterium]|nr:addiction module antitoxin RelB [Campylobacterota bacterium]